MGNNLERGSSLYFNDSLLHDVQVSKSALVEVVVFSKYYANFRMVFPVITKNDVISINYFIALVYDSFSSVGYMLVDDFYVATVSASFVINVLRFDCAKYFTMGYIAFR